jgi:hypothetical protein
LATRIICCLVCKSDLKVIINETETWLEQL